MNAMDQIDVKEGVDQETVDAVKELSGTYKHGWNTEIEMDYAPKGVNPDIVRLISDKNNEPEWMTDWRLAALQRWEKMEEPTWAMVNYPDIDFPAALLAKRTLAASTMMVFARNVRAPRDRANPRASSSS